MRRIREIDGDRHTVLMVQVQNEPGCIPEARDYAEAANKAYQGPVPQQLMDYMQQNHERLMPELRELWETAGLPASGTWEEVFGNQVITEDLFMAWNYARYIDVVAQAWKKEYPLPMFVNAALVRPNYPPGRYNSVGPLPHSFDISERVMGLLRNQMLGSKQFFTIQHGMPVIGYSYYHISYLC